uniref:(northern house mosquito) hypothetical protein n=1 Tax=Culex pipiens TaxID=7175 RepID=A0A8D8AZQ1_CULPI
MTRWPHVHSGTGSHLSTPEPVPSDSVNPGAVIWWIVSILIMLHIKSHEICKELFLTTFMTRWPHGLTGTGSAGFRGTRVQSFDGLFRTSLCCISNAMKFLKEISLTICMTRWPLGLAGTGYGAYQMP